MNGSKRPLLAFCCLVGSLSLVLIAVGHTLDWQNFGSVASPRGLRRACLQLGGLGLVVTLAVLPLLLLTPEKRARTIVRIKKALLVLLISSAFLFGVGELSLRLIYSDGMSFGSHGGPLVKRFERNFRFNRFDGPSRGLEVTGSKRPNEVRILFQGDSITWGQGIRNEELLFPARLLDQLQQENPAIEGAVLAKPGREIDEHLAQLRKWGQEIQPDLIIYQWFINDMELDKSQRPQPRGRIWRDFFFHGRLRASSYLWFLLDYRLDLALPSGVQSYSQYIYQVFPTDSVGWARFTELFRTWAAEAKRLTPRVAVALYPVIRSEVQFAEFHVRLIDLCREEGIAPIELTPWLEEFKSDHTEMFATRFDSHPNALVHDRIATALHENIRTLWPELLASP